MSFGILQGRLSKSPAGCLQWFPQEFWEHEFFLAQTLGLSYIEFFVERDHNPDNPLWSPAGLARIRRLSEYTGLDCYSVCNDFIIEHSLATESVALDQSLRLIRRIAHVGVKRLVLPMLEHSEVRLDNWESFRAGLTKIAQSAAQADVVVCLETILDAVDLLELLDKLAQPNLKVTFDTGNRAARGQRAADELRRLKGCLAHVHLKDKNHRDENVLLGTGLVPFDEVFQALMDIDYQGRCTFETCRGADPVETARYNLVFAGFFANEACRLK